MEYNVDRTIIFLSGLGVPKILARSRFIWNDPLWQNYRRIYVTTKIPTSDKMVERELANLCQLVNSFTNVAIAGQSLGAWWGANLACYPEANIKKLIMWTPLGDASCYPIFNVTPRHHPMNKSPNLHNVGAYRTAVFSAKYDIVVPIKEHAITLSNHFDALNYHLDGGHFFQKNHQAGLHFMKEWIELD